MKKQSNSRTKIKDIKTLIVGGGIAGLGCARTLADKGEKDFLVISPELLGRIPHSDDGNVNYGVYYAREDYGHVLPYLTLTKRINFWRDYYLNRRGTRSFFDFRNLKHVPALIRLYFFVREKYPMYLQFKHRCLEVSQKQALDEFPELKEHYQMDATEFIKNHGLQYWDRHFFSHLIRYTTFVDSNQMNAAIYGGVLLPLFIPTYEFRFNLEKLIESFFEHIVKDEVISIKRLKNNWSVTTKEHGSFTADNLVVATPMNITHELLSLKEKINRLVAVRLFHIRGELRLQYCDYQTVFLDNSLKDLFITTEPDGTHLFYTWGLQPDFDKYFDRFEIIAEKYWHPAMFMGKHMVESNRGNNLYVIGDHNISSMEDTYITGIYAAKKIIGGN